MDPQAQKQMIREVENYLLSHAFLGPRGSESSVEPQRLIARWAVLQCDYLLSPERR